MLLCRIIRWELVLILSFILQGVELGPLEITINSLQKSIEARQQEIAELQQMWLRQQSELVQLTKDKDMQSVDVRKLKKQLTILSQKKIRTEGKSSLFITCIWCMQGDSLPVLIQVHLCMVFVGL